MNRLSLLYPFNCIKSEIKQKKQNIIILKKEESSCFNKMIEIACFPSYVFKGLIGKLISPIALGTAKRVQKVNIVQRTALKNLGGEEISFKFKSDFEIEGMFFQNKVIDQSAQKTVLLCTGSHLSYENYAVPMVRELMTLGHHVLVFNYQGFGKSEGSRSENGVYQSTEAAYQYLRQHKKCADDSIIAWGYSLGSGAVTELATKHDIDIVIDRGFSSMSEVAYNAAPRFMKLLAKVLFVIALPFNNLIKLKKIKGRTFIAQGIYDSGMQKENHGLKLKEANPNGIYVEMNFGHFHSENNIWFDQNYPDSRKKINDYLANTKSTSNE